MSRGAWSSPEAAETYLIKVWGANRYAVASGRYSVAGMLKQRTGTPGALSGRYISPVLSSALERVDDVRTALRTLSPRIRTFRYCSERFRASKAPVALPWADSFDAFVAAFESLSEVVDLERDEPKAKRKRRGGQAERRRIVIEEAVARDPGLSGSPSEWAYFGVANGMNPPPSRRTIGDEECSAAEVFKRVNVKDWQLAIPPSIRGRKARRTDLPFPKHFAAMLLDPHATVLDAERAEEADARERIGG